MERIETSIERTQRLIAESKALRFRQMMHRANMQALAGVPTNGSQLHLVLTSEPPRAAH